MYPTLFIKFSVVVVAWAEGPFNYPNLPPNTVPIVSTILWGVGCYCDKSSGFVIVNLRDLELLSHHMNPSFPGQQPAASSKSARKIRHVDSFSDSDEV